MQAVIRFIKDWTLPIAMGIGAFTYVTFACVPALSGVKPALLSIAEWLMPTVIFLMLFFTFCRISPQDMRPKRWQWQILGFQTFAAILVAIVAVFFHLKGENMVLAQGLLICLLAPTATAAAVIAAKLGCNAAAVTTHALLDNLWVALLIVLLLPLVQHHAQLSLVQLITKLLTEVSRILILPLVLAWLLQWSAPRLHAICKRWSGAAFYLWGVALIMVMAQTMRFVIHAPGGIRQVLLLSTLSALCCFGQFYLGRRIGLKYGEKIATGQALAQKNTVFAMWLAYTFLTPATTIAAGTYVVWQNLFNAWQLWCQKSKNE